MALARVKVWGSEILTSSDLNGEINNILNNALSLISPLTGDLAAGGNKITGLSLGSEGSPSLQFTGDTNTGVFSSGADTLDFSTAGVNSWRISSAGKLLCVDDNTYDIGASGATRPKDLYLGGAVKGGAWQATAVATQYGGTGQDFSATAQGNTLYFSAAGTVAALGPGTSGQFLKTLGAAANPAWDWPINNMLDARIVRKDSDESLTSNATPQADDELLFAIGASETWVFSMFVIYTGGTAGDIQVGIQAPSLATGLWSASGLDVAVSTPGNYKSVGVTDLDGSTALTFGCSGSGAPNFHTVQVHGNVVNSTNAGNVTLFWAQGASNGTATVVKAGSYLIAYRIA